MIKALLLIFEPFRTWDGIARSEQSLARIFAIYLLPMVLITSAVEGFGLAHWGKLQSAEYERLNKFTPAEATVYETMQAILTILVVFVAAKFLKSLGDTFHGRHSLTQTFKTIAYGLSPMFLLRLLDVFPQVSPWVSWILGIVLSVAVLYQGLPRVMQPDPPHAFGLYFMNSLLLILITGLARFVTAWYLSGHFKPVERVISAIAAKLPF
jgi:hypothetical protein